MSESHVCSAESVVDAAVDLVAQWVLRADESENRADRAQSGRLRDVMADPASVAFTMSFVDRVARPDNPSVSAKQLNELVRHSGLPSFLSPLDRIMLSAGAALAPRLPRVVMPIAQWRMRQMVGHLVADSETRSLVAHLDARRAEGFKMNVNLLGEAVLGHAEADRRLAQTMELIAEPAVDYVSIKLSSVAAQLSPWAFDDDCERLRDRLRPVFRAAEASTPTTFINLDMEEYRDLALTIEVFTSLLDEDEFRSVSAGIVVQAYLPDSYAAVRHLSEWSQDRVASGGAGIKVRLVKGANLAMERVEATMHGWEQAPFRSKADTDANYKRCLDWVLDPQRLSGLRLGVASHNLFDVAWAHLLADGRGVGDRVEFEMLQGMAPAQSRVVKRDAGSVLLYTPAVSATDFDVAISYLFRRLEENAAPENFMHSLFDLAPGSDGFVKEEGRFREAVERRTIVPADPFATQNRLVQPSDDDLSPVFQNEADTDPRLANNRAWAAALVARSAIECSAPMTENAEEIDRILERAVAAKGEWSSWSAEQRQIVLKQVAQYMTQVRGDLVSTMVHEASKTVGQADPEVSEAIDFARYYADRAMDFAPVDGATFTPAGVSLVVPPWNFPVAIPAGGVFASLAAGNVVILKPAPETPRCAELIAEACWAAGIPRDVVQFVRCPDDHVGQRLVTHPSVDVVVLTGAMETANLFRSWKPELNLLAETSGKNALVISPSADLDLAVADLVASAFGHSGQKCSAASIAICLDSVYESDRFRRQLVDAVESIKVGPADDLTTLMNPLIGPAEGKLLRALTSLEPGEEWLVKPRKLDESGQMWSPGVKIGVAAGSWFHTTECFGPVLAIMRADDLADAVRLQNASAFGLTGGIHTLDPEEIDYWLEHVEVGNAYINRGITGAIVQRQPFGGWKQSAVGPGAKAGGPNYVMGLGEWSDSAERDAAWLQAARASDAAWWAKEFGQSHDPTGLWCEGNELRYRAVPRVAIRASDDANAVEVERCIAAAERAGVTPVVSRASVEGDLAFGDRLRQFDRVRCVGSLSADLRRASIESGVYVAATPVVGSGRIELLNYVREQAVSRTLHRFGNVVSPVR